jgi:cytochrome c biogenesis protein CcmG, thiol:disulfide interchange protein DsbE
MAGQVRKLLRIVGFCSWMVLLFFMIYVVWTRTFLPHGEQLIGNKAPEIITTPIEGYAAIPPLWQVLRHDVVLLNFFATWCGPCQAEHPLLIELAENYQLHVMGVASRDAAGRITTFLEEKGNPYSYLGIDKMDATSVAYQVKGLPESYLIHKDGAVLAYHSGILTKEAIKEKFFPYLTAVSDE